MTWTSSSRSRGASWCCTRGASSPTARRTRCAPTRRSRPCTWGRRRGRRDAGAPPGPRLLWSEPRAVRRGPRGAGRGGRLAARPERRRQDDDAQVHRRAGRRDGRRDPVRGTVAARAPHPRDLAPGHRLCAGGPADLRRPHGGREPEGGERPGGGWTVERVFGLFPKLRELGGQRGASLAGGEQPMLTLARTLMTSPRLLLLDEPSEGLAPVVVRALAENIAALKGSGLTILLSEQNVKFARRLADRAYIIEKGQIRFEGSFGHLDANESLRRAYLSV